MNTLDIIIGSIILLFMLSGKYDGAYKQINRCLSLFLSIFITRILLYELVPILIPYLGLSIHIKAITFYISIVIFYFFSKFIMNILVFRYEPSKKNKIIQSIIGSMLGFVNGSLILGLVTSIIFYIFSTHNQLLLKLSSSVIFQYIYNVNLILFNYAK